MKSILVDYLEGVTFKGDLGTAEDILFLVEEAGMLPPIQDKEAYLYVNAFDEKYIYLKELEWEPEE